MSAILARVNFDGAPIDRDAFHRAFEIIAQYGGDGSDAWVEGSVGLGQHLLRFTPESYYEAQPHHWDEAVIVADARLDNRDELCPRFGLSQAEAAVTPDSHLILRAYRLWGEDCVPHLLGDFAFAIWDQRNRRLFCARDHIGARPLYYYHTPSITIVATDIRALQGFPEVSNEIDEFEVASHLLWPLAISKNSFLKSVHILHAGQQISIDRTGLKQQAHWSADDIGDVRYKTVAEYTEHFRAVLDTAIAVRIRTDYPVGAHLSGGLDSSGITVLANRLLRQEGRSLEMTYTWTPAKSDAYPLVRGDERNTIEKLCQQENIPCCYGTATGQDFRHFLGRDMAAEMTADVFEDFPVLAYAEQHGIRTLLSGWGGDEAATFAGRGYLASLLKKARLWQLAWIARRYAGIRKPRRTLRFLFRYAVIPLLPNALYNWVDPYYRSDRKTSYINPAFAAQYSQAATPDIDSWREIGDPRRMQARLLQAGHLANRMATWAVWSSEHRLVYTYPLTDRRVLEFALGLPPKLLYQQGTWRFLFREALKDALPPLPPKADPVNERKRLNCWLECWRILADEVRAGQLLQSDIPWLDVEKLRKKVLAVPDEMTSEQLPEFIPLTTAIRVWHLWQRYGERAGNQH